MKNILSAIIFIVIIAIVLTLQAGPYGHGTGKTTGADSLSAIIGRFDTLREYTAGQGIVFDDSATFLNDVILEQQTSELFKVNSADGDTIELNAQHKESWLRYSDGGTDFFRADTTGKVWFDTLKLGSDDTPDKLLHVYDSGSEIGSQIMIGPGISSVNLAIPGITISSSGTSNNNGIIMGIDGSNYGGITWINTTTDYMQIDANRELKIQPNAQATTVGGDVNIGTNTAGANLTVKATEGTELVITNPDFTTDLTGWTGGADWTWHATGKAVHAATAGNTFYPTVSVVIVADNTYKVTFTISGYSAGSITMTLGGVLGTVREENGTFSSYVVASNTDNLIFTPTTTFVGMLDDISVKQVTQGTITSEGVNTFAGRVILESGHAGSPAMVFSNDANKVGWFRYGATSMGYATDGVTRQIFTPSTHWINSDAATISLGTTTPDVWIRRNAANNIELGNVDAAAPDAQTLSVQNVLTGTANTAGANLTIAGSQGTGTGAGGSILFQTAPAGGAGSAQNALATAITIASTGHVGIGVAPDATYDLSIEDGMQINPVVADQETPSLTIAGDMDSDVSDVSRDTLTITNVGNTNPVNGYWYLNTTNATPKIIFKTIKFECGTRKIVNSADDEDYWDVDNGVLTSDNPGGMLIDPDVAGAEKVQLGETGDNDTTLVSGIFAINGVGSNVLWDTASDDDYEVTSKHITAYVPGLEVKVYAKTANTGAATLQINALGAVALKTTGDDDPANDYIEAESWFHCIYDTAGTDHWELLSPDSNP